MDREEMWSPVMPERKERTHLINRCVEREEKEKKRSWFPIRSGTKKEAQHDHLERGKGN